MNYGRINYRNTAIQHPAFFHRKKWTAFLKEDGYIPMAGFQVLFFSNLFKPRKIFQKTKQNVCRHDWVCACAYPQTPLSTSFKIFHEELAKFLLLCLNSESFDQKPSVWVYK